MRPYVNILLHVFLSVFGKYSVTLHIVVREHMHHNIKIGSCHPPHISHRVAEHPVTVIRGSRAQFLAVFHTLSVLNIYLSTIIYFITVFFTNSYIKCLRNLHFHRYSSVIIFCPVYYQRLTSLIGKKALVSPFISVSSILT